MENVNIQTMTRGEADAKGIAGFNTCEHTVIDLSQMKEGMHTVSVLLPNGDAATFCVIPFFTASGGQSGTIDMKYHTKNGESTIIAFTNKGDLRASADMYTLDYKKEK